MPMNLYRFAVRLQVLVDPPEIGRQAEADLQEEMAARTHYVHPLVYWDQDAQRLFVELVTPETDETMVADQVGEELIEAASAVVGDFQRLHVDVLDVKPIVSGNDLRSGSDFQQEGPA